MIYKPEYCTELVELMAQGLVNCEIIAQWDINQDTFYDWRKRYPEFEAAYLRGKDKCEAYYVRSAREAWLKGDDKGFKYFIALMNNKFGWSQGSNQNQTTNQINIKNINVLDAKSDQDLIELIQKKLTRLPIAIENIPIDIQLVEEDKTND